MGRTAALRRVAALLLLAGALLPGGCGSDHSNGPAAPADVANLTEPGFDLSGGPGGAGGEGGVFTARSGRSILVTTASPPAPPAPTAVVNTVKSVDADLTFTGTTEIAGNIMNSGTGSLRSITVNGGDLIVSGTLERTDGGGGFSLSASGMVLITGLIRTSGGPVTIRSGGVVDLRGPIETSGAAVVADTDGARGGTAGGISIEADGDVVVASAFRFRGGRAWTSGAGAVGGEGGSLSIQGAAIGLFGVLDGRGGSATAASPGAGIQGGRGGQISIGTKTAALSLTLQEGRFAAGGGKGDLSGGRGGSFDLLASSEGMHLAGSFAAEGGDSGTTPGAGGRFKAECDVVGGDLECAASILVSGGSAVPSATDAPGGAGGRIELSAWFDPSRSTAGSGGSIFLASSSILTADGGSSTGSAAAGKGGTIHLEIPEARVSLGGLLAARGGSALGSGAGGLGGFLWVDTDANANALGGDITVETGGLLDASGGSSASGPGGDAQWSTTPNLFQPEVIPVAILLDADSVFGGPNPGGIIQNNGKVVARGARSNGHGGDVYFHGRSAGTREPERGDVENAGDGSGGDGVFTSD